MAKTMGNHLANIVAGLYLKRIDEFVANPYGAQRESWDFLLGNLRKTEYGRRYGAGHVLNYEAFSRNFPVVGYEEIAKYVQRMREGEPNVLWPGYTLWYARSSGTTTSKSKFIPVTEDVLQRCHYRGGYDLLSLYVRNNPQTNFYRGKGLTLGGSHQVEKQYGVSREGDLSAILLQNEPLWVDMVRLPSRDVALLADWKQKLEGIARECIGKKITSITGVPSWNLVMLNHLLEVSGYSTVGEMWPSLEVFFHGGVNFTPYREEFKRVIGLPDMRFMESYNASEGYFALQDDPTRSDMLLLLDNAVFYEFIDMDEFFSPNREVVPLEGVRTDRNYAMLITSTNGLVRYLIGDTVRFTSVSPHRILITGRTKLYINAFGEELIVNNADRALEKACRQTGAEVAEYTAGPVFMEGSCKGRHEWMIEFTKAPGDLKLFAQIFDQALTQENSDYEAKRTGNTTLLPPIVHSLPQGSFFGWLESRGKLGGQNKVPRLYNDRTQLESLSAYLEQRGIRAERVE